MGYFETLVSFASSRFSLCLTAASLFYLILISLLYVVNAISDKREKILRSGSNLQSEYESNNLKNSSEH